MCLVISISIQSYSNHEVLTPSLLLHLLLRSSTASLDPWPQTLDTKNVLLIPITQQKEVKSGLCYGS